MNQRTNKTTLSLLRDLMPKRTLDLQESYRIAELQAARLRILHDAHDPMLTEDIITEQPRITVATEADLPSSGMTFWNGDAWMLLLGRDEARTRQRFSLLHEYKHILDHSVREHRELSHRDNERVADYFAACALMPKRLVKRHYCGGTQQPEALAYLFGVSPQAMRYRLNQLGLTEPPKRCQRWIPADMSRSAA